jgi:hypothetical protein
MEPRVEVVHKDSLAFLLPEYEERFRDRFPVALFPAEAEAVMGIKDALNTGIKIIVSDVPT